MLMLKTASPAGLAYGGFTWPEQGRVSCPDWDPSPACGGGLLGLPWGVGEQAQLSSDPEARWLVWRAQGQVVQWEGKGKAQGGEVLYCGDRQGALDYLAEHGGREAWEEMARDPDREVRMWLARNPALAGYPQVIETLSRDRDPAVRRRLARNPALTGCPQVIETLARDPDREVRMWLARNPALAG